MLWTTTKRIIRSGFFNFSRNAFVSLSSVLVMVITLSMISSLIFVSAILNASLQEIKNKVDINVYFVTTADESDVVAVQETLRTLPEVAEVTYVSREDALEAFKKLHENDQLILQSLDELGDNPLGATLNIKAKNPSQYEGIALFLQSKQTAEGTSIISDVNYYRNKVTIDKLTNFIASAERLGSILPILLVILSVIITLNTIRLAIYVSREEIAIMRLVGASTFYIRGPFVVVGIIYGIVAGILTLIIFYPVTYWLGGVTSNFFIGMNIFDYYTQNFGQIFLVIMASGIVIGAISSYLAVRKYLTV